MKKAVASLLLLLLAGCAQIERMNDNMEVSIQSIDANTSAINKSSGVISDNTHAISQATTMFRAPGIFFLLIVVLGVFAALLFSLVTLKDIQKNLKQLINKNK
jgi:hypothetical protein